MRSEKKEKKLRVIITGGGSGGHIYPLLAVSSALRSIAFEKGREVSIIYVGASGLYGRVLRDANIPTLRIASSKFRRYFSLLNAVDAVKFFYGMAQALVKIPMARPSVVFSKGGPGALPVVLVARIYRIPVVIHESDSIPGISNAISSRFADVIAVSFPSTIEYFKNSKGRVVLSGNPIRDELTASDISQAEAKEHFGLRPSEPLTCVFGGSRGSVFINEYIIAHLRDILPISQILHQTGIRNHESIIERFRGMEMNLPNGIARRYHAVPYFDRDMHIALAAADIVIGRAGSSIFEIAAFGKPSILIPHGAGNGHQARNAAEYAEAGAAFVINENDIPERLVQSIKEILKPEVYKKMKKSALSFHRPDAALNLAEILITI